MKESSRRKDADSTTDNISQPEFKGYTIEEIRFQRALVALKADFCKTRFLERWNNIQQMNPLSSKSGAMFSSKFGPIAGKMFKSLNYVDYVMLGISLYGTAKKFFSLFSHKKKK